MGTYAYLMCHDCRQQIFLGKACRRDSQPFFHIGDATSPANWTQHQFNQVLWKFLADHCGHHIDVRLEWDTTEEMAAYQNIGGDTSDDITFEQYLSGWPGLAPSKTW